MHFVRIPHSVCTVKSMPKLENFQNVCNGYMSEGKEMEGKRRIFNISDTINCFKPFRCQAALFKFEIVSVSTFVARLSS